MYISTELNSVRKYGTVEECILLLKEAGFEAYDCSLFEPESEAWLRLIESDTYLLEANKIRKYADSIGMPCNQTHAPEPTFRRGNEAYNRQILPKLIRSIEVSGVLGAKVCVVHPNCRCDDPYAQNFEFYSSLLPYARKAGVKLALENMWDWDDELGHATPTTCSSHNNFKTLLDMFQGEENICACLDIGHAEMKGLDTDAVQMINTLDKRIQALHIHDNDKVNDDHMLPFFMNVDYGKIIKALIEMDYKGDITLESGGFLRKIPVGLYPQAVRYMAETAKYIRGEVLKGIL